MCGFIIRSASAAAEALVRMHKSVGDVHAAIPDSIDAQAAI